MPVVVKSEFVCETALVNSCQAPTIAETSNGFVVAWYANDAEKKTPYGIWLSRLVDGKWSIPTEIAIGAESSAGRYPCWNPVLFQTKEGMLSLFYKVGPNARGWWGMLITSSDDGRSWSKPSRLPDGIVGPTKNKPVRLADGSLISGSSSETPSWQVHFERSSDGGRTWSSTPKVSSGLGISAIEPSILIHSNGRLQSIGRTKQGHIFEVNSQDNGRTWGELKLLPLPNPSSGVDALTLADGRHLIVYNHSTSERVPLNVAVSSDGKAWAAALVLESQPGDYSYPSVIESRDHLLHVVYAWKQQASRIKHVVINPKLFRPQPILGEKWPEQLPGDSVPVRGSKVLGSQSVPDAFAGGTAGHAKELVPGINFRWCPPGTFTMGSPKSELGHNNRRHGNEDQVQVTISSGFWLGETEVTQGQWKSLMNSTPWRGRETVREGENYAASYISHGDSGDGKLEADSASEFCRRLTEEERRAGRLPARWRYALPTEAQWEYACRAGTRTKFGFAEDESHLGDYAWFSKNTIHAGESFAHAVGQKRANPWGFKDMHGNVWEWCADWYSDRLLGGTDPVVLSIDSVRIHRGGSWRDDPSGCRSSVRSRPPSIRYVGAIGLRVACVRAK